MEHETGDEYIRRISSFIHTHERNLAESGLNRRRRHTAPPVSGTSVFNPLGWFATGGDASSTPVKSLVLSIDAYHLFYILIRLEALGIDVGTLDVQVDSPSRPMNFVTIPGVSDKSETLSLASFRSSLSAVSGLSLGAGWWGRPEPPSVDAELKYIYSSFTKLPALSIIAPGPKVITELMNEPPNENALPLHAFKNLLALECLDIDPRTLLGWDKLSVSLRSLTVKRSGLEDVTDIFIGAVLDDQARREGRQRSRQRNFARGPSRQASFHSTQLPETVPEDAEETPTPEQDAPLPPHTRSEEQSMNWAFLKHLSLADNALTFLPTAPLPRLTSLTHLDLSSNLLVSVPPGLSALYNLISLNLSDNMIDSVLGIYQNLGQILILNLARNRLESICGLERLLALEKVDLRHNLVEESAEIGRLATLPNIADIWIEGNPLMEIEETYRITCFDYFWKEGRVITLDGSSPGFYEKRGLTARPPEQMSSSRPVSTAYSPPVVAVGGASLTHPSPTFAAQEGPKTPQLSPSPGDSSNVSPHLSAAVIGGKPRRRKNKRIVELDGHGHEVEHSDSSGSRFESRPQSVAVSVANHGKLVSTRDASPGRPQQLKSATQAQMTSEAEPSHTGLPPKTVVASRPTPRSRHSRYHTEYAANAEPPAIESLSSSSMAGSLRLSKRGSATLSSKSATRRARVSASVYEPPTDSMESEQQEREADAYRKRIEALRSDMGDGWLKVLSQSQMGGTGVASG